MAWFQIVVRLTRIDSHRKVLTATFVLIGNCVSQFLHFTAAKKHKGARAISLRRMIQAESS